MRLRPELTGAQSGGHSPVMPYHAALACTSITRVDRAQHWSYSRHMPSALKVKTTHKAVKSVAQASSLPEVGQRPETPDDADKISALRRPALLPVPLGPGITAR